MAIVNTADIVKVYSIPQQQSNQFQPKSSKPPKGSSKEKIPKNPKTAKNNLIRERVNTKGAGATPGKPGKGPPRSWDWSMEHVNASWENFLDGFGKMGDSLTGMLNNAGSNLLANAFDTNAKYDSVIDFINSPVNMRSGISQNNINVNFIYPPDFTNKKIYTYPKGFEDLYPHFWWKDEVIVDSFEPTNPLKFKKVMEDSDDQTWYQRWERSGQVEPDTGFRVRSKAIARLKSLEPDFMKHKFDAYFLWDIYNGENESYDFDKILKENKWLSNYEKYILSKRGFAVRFGKVSIPKVLNEDFTLSFLETEISKIKSRKVYENQTSFSLRLDQDLIWLDQIQMMAGHGNTIDEKLAVADNDKEKGNPYLKSIVENDVLFPLTDQHPEIKRWRSLLKCVARTWPGSGNAGHSLKDSELCLVIKMSHLSNFIDTAYQRKKLPYFIFENVKILGTSDKISYDRSSTEPQTINVSFIYKKCYQVTQDDFEDNYTGIIMNDGTDKKDFIDLIRYIDDWTGEYYINSAINYKGIGPIKTFDEDPTVLFRTGEPEKGSEPPINSGGTIV